MFFKIPGIFPGIFLIRDRQLDLLLLAARMSERLQLAYVFGSARPV